MKDLTTINIFYYRTLVPILARLMPHPPRVKYLLRVELPPLPGLKRNFAVIPGIRQVSKKRLLQEAGVLPDSFLRQLEEVVRLYLGES